MNGEMKDMNKKIVGVMTVILFAIYFLAMIYKWNTVDNIVASVISLLLFLIVYKGCVEKEKDGLVRMGEKFLSFGLFAWFLCETIWLIADSFFAVNPIQIRWLTNIYSFTNLFILFFIIV